MKTIKHKACLTEPLRLEKYLIYDCADNNGLWFKVKDLSVMLNRVTYD